MSRKSRCFGLLYLWLSLTKFSNFLLIAITFLTYSKFTKAEITYFFTVTDYLSTYELLQKMCIMLTVHIRIVFKLITQLYYYLEISFYQFNLGICTNYSNRVTITTKTQTQGKHTPFSHRHQVHDRYSPLIHTLTVTAHGNTACDPQSIYQQIR